MVSRKMKILLFLFILVCFHHQPSYALDATSNREIRLKVILQFLDRPDDFARLSFYLHKEEETSSPVWDTLKVALNNDESFRAYTNMLVEDTKSFDNNEKFQRFINDVHYAFTKPTSDKGDGNQGVNKIPSQAVPISTLPSMAKVLSLISKEDQKAFLPIFKSYCQAVGGQRLVSVADDVVGLVNKHGGTTTMTFLASAYLTSVVLENINLYYNGEISGKRCVKNILDSTAAVGGGVAGGLFGAKIGTAFGPGGTLLGGLIGSIAGSYVGEKLSDRLNQWIFDLPKEVALENAFNYLGLNAKASNNEINKAFHKLAKISHPDVKGGSHDDFVKLNYFMALIKASRE